MALFEMVMPLQFAYINLNISRLFATNFHFSKYGQSKFTYWNLQTMNDIPMNEMSLDEISIPLKT